MRSPTSIYIAAIFFYSENKITKKQRQVFKTAVFS